MFTIQPELFLAYIGLELKHQLLKNSYGTFKHFTLTQTTNLTYILSRQYNQEQFYTNPKLLAFHEHICQKIEITLHNK